MRRLLRSPILDVAVALITLARVAQIVHVLPSRALTYDFNLYYVSSRLLLEGHPPYTTPVAELSDRYGFEHSEEIQTATNPPLLLWMFAPVAMLPPRTAFWAWLGIEVISLITILYLTRHLLRDSLSERGWWFVCAATLSSAPVMWHFAFSRVEMTLAAIVLGAYACQKAGKHTTACIAVTLAGMVKLYPLALLPWFVWRTDTHRRRVLNTYISLILIGVVILLTGPKLWADFLAHAVPLIRRFSVFHTFNFTLPSFVINVGRMLCGLMPSPEPGSAWWLAGSTVGIGTLCGAYALCALKQDRDCGFSILCAAMLATTPTAWGHYFVFLIFPAAVAAARIVKTMREGLLLSVMLVILNCQGPWGDSLFTRWPLGKLLLNYVPLYGVLGLAVFCARAGPVVATQTKR